MTQEIELKIRNLHTDLTHLVREGLDEDGTVLRRMLAELERWENLRSSLRNSTTESPAHSMISGADQQGGSHAGIAI